MKPTILLVVLAFSSCIMPTETDTAALGASWYDVRDECERVCRDIYAMQCALVREPRWYPSCTAGCVRLADEAQATGCLDQAEDWQRCEQTQERICWGVYPYQLTDYCHAEGDTYGACRRDS